MFDILNNLNGKMVYDIEQKGVTDKRVLDAIRSVPRHNFVPLNVKIRSYDDSALPIGERQTISQPYIVAYMTAALDIRRSDKVLEIGTGSGYQTAILAKLCSRVYTIELNKHLASQAVSNLKKIKIDNVHFFVGDGFDGVRQEAPFNAIIVTAAPTHLPQELFDQLDEGGRMIIPVGPNLDKEPLSETGGENCQWLYLVKKENGQLRQKRLIPVRFVPMLET